MFCDEKFFKILYSCFLFIQKLTELVLEKLPYSGLVGCRNLLNPSLGNAFNLLMISLRYTLAFEWSDFGLKYLVTAMLKGQPPKFKANVSSFSISETGTKCNSVFRHADGNWVIIMELKIKVEYGWTCTFWASLCFKGYRSLPWTWDGLRYYKLAIATGVTSTSIF